jgi:hypothetical protein
MENFMTRFAIEVGLLCELQMYQKNKMGKKRSQIIFDPFHFRVRHRKFVTHR